jgi:large subunit ribosomal protein L4
MLRGGGVAHGPKPRSFATELPRKMYDRAWRMALSYRYRRGQLVVVDKLGIPAEVPEADRQYWLKWALDGLGWGKGGEGHSFYITAAKGGVFGEALEACDRYGRQRSFHEVDVKNLLEMKRLVVERSALREMLKYHQSDLQMPLVKTPEQIAKHAEIAALQQVSELEMAKAVAAAQAAEVNAKTSGGLMGSTVAAAGAAAAVSGINDLSMDEIDRAAAEAEELLGEEEEFDMEEALESDELVDHEELEPMEEKTR